MRFGTKKMVYTGVLIALGVVLPIGFHMAGAGGQIFLPMHIPVFLAGVILGSELGMIVGIVTPILSSLLTGMPPMIPMLPIMVVELALYGLVIGWLCHKKQIFIYISLVISMLAGRIGAGVVVWILVHLFGITTLPANPWFFITGSITTGLPGIIVQLVLIPLVIYYLKNRLDLSEDGTGYSA